ncbi:MAG: hypothetical protein HY423_00330 [Candidatus Lambdaproteobacteria bacterium]|nr:hypothetical protein [Candidatus Lambdaproteobacteria bacterium]
MPRGIHPEYHKALLDAARHDPATRRVKFSETCHSYFYRTGEFVYKIRKPSPAQSSLALKEAYAQSALAAGARWSPEVYLALVPIVHSADPPGFALGGAGEPVDYALKLAPLSEAHWLDHLIENHKLNPTAVGRVARYLATQHQAHPLGAQAATLGRPEHFRELFEELLYQIRQYLDVTLTQAMLDMVVRPLDKFVEDSRKLFLRRIKKGRIVEGHGAFTPAHVHVKGKDVRAIAPLESPQKYRQLDAANDVATMCVELARLGADGESELFVQRYISAAHDRDLVRMLPAYKTFQALRQGLAQSEQLIEDRSRGDAEGVAAAQRLAQHYYSLAVRFAREIGRAPEAKPAHAAP